MIGGIFATIFGVICAHTWAKEERIEQKMKKETKAKYYQDKWGNIRKTSTCQKVQGEEVLSQLNDAKYKMLYNKYVNRMNIYNNKAEKERSNPNIGPFSTAGYKYIVMDYNSWNEKQPIIDITPSMVDKDDYYLRHSTLIRQYKDHLINYDVLYDEMFKLHSGVITVKNGIKYYAVSRKDGTVI